MGYKIIIDADSMIYASCVNVNNLSEAKNKLNVKINEALNELDDLGYDIEQFIVCSGNYGNFRKIISNTYKANRASEKPELLTALNKYCRTDWNSKIVLGVETDDVVASHWRTSIENNEKPIIVSIDKDYLQLPATIYNYQKKTITEVSEVDSLRNLYYQMIVGDNSDNIKGVAGCGDKKAVKVLSGLSTKYSMSKAVYKLYLERYKGKANIKYRESYLLLKLRTDVVKGTN